MSAVPLLERNRTEVVYPRNSTIAELFATQAVRTPDAPAIAAGDRCLTYRELDERSNQLAHHLQDLGIKAGTLVGIAMGRSESLVIGLLAILKAGGAYVPLDPTYPTERLAWMIEDSGMRVILTTAETRDRMHLQAGHLAAVDAGDLAIGKQSPQAVRSNAISRDLAYVIYTSGSTGKPRGVMVENRNVVNFFTGMDQAIGCAPGVWLAVTSVCFDISVLELLWTLTRGFKVVIHGDEDFGAIADEIVRHHVTHLQMTPSLARILTLDSRVFAALRSLKHLLLGGEAVPVSLVRLLREVFKGEIRNMYGPTETTVWSTTYRVEDVGSTLPIGRPIANTQIFLLDENMTPASEGEVGELFVGGDGVARGYWNRPDLTAERFLNIAALSDQRIYRTGDLARNRPDGNIEFLGRADYQIKVRGHRIEPGEIEGVLERCPGVQQAVIVAREDREGDKRLVAYLVADATGAEAVAVLRNALESKVPEYMIPSAFVFLSELPLTDNGKIDRKALLKLEPPSVAPTSSAQAGDRPANEVERIVANLWQEALGIATIGLHDNFFDAGAHSLSVAEVHARLQQTLGRQINLVDLYQFSTVRSLAGHLAGEQEVAAATQLSDRALRRRMARQR